MMDWKEILDEPVSKKHRNQVLRAVSGALQENKAASGEKRRWFMSKAWGLGLAGAVAIAGIIMVKKQAPDLTAEDMQLLTLAPEILEGEDLDLLTDLEIIENLEDLEKWENS